MDLVLHKVKKYLHNNNLLQYSSTLDIPNTNRMDGVVRVAKCDLCRYFQCVWNYNKESMKVDNLRLLLHPTNKQRHKLRI